MRIIVASVRTPFVRGGAEVLAEELTNALHAAGHEADLVVLPFNPEPEKLADQMLACALMDLECINGAKVDRMIALKFPAYLIPHPCKVVWLMHQHRNAYDLWEHSLGSLRNSPRGAMVRDIIRRADAGMCSEAKAIFTLSETVTARLRQFLNVESKPLHHPPAGVDAFYCAEPEDYVFFPSRISGNKRQDLALRALALTHSPVRMRFAGTPDTADYGARVVKLARELGVQSRIEWLGYITDEVKRETYAHALAVMFPPFDEDYGYVTLEAMLASKPVITCNDSGGPLEFVITGQTGLVVAPTPEGLATAMDAFWDDRQFAVAAGQAGRLHYMSLGLSWAKVIKRLLA